MSQSCASRARYAVSISIEGSIHVARTIVDVLERIGPIGLSAEGNSQVITALSPTAIASSRDRRIVLVVA